MIEELADIEAGTCIRFEPREDEIDYIEIIDGLDCSSKLGKMGKISICFLKISVKFC